MYTMSMPIDTHNCAIVSTGESTYTYTNLRPYVCVPSHCWGNFLACAGGAGGSGGGGESYLAKSSAASHSFSLSVFLPPKPIITFSIAGHHSM